MGARLPVDPRAFEAAVGRIQSLRHPLALVLPHPAPAPDLPDLPNVEWVRTGYSEPWFPILPDGEILRQIEREATALTDLGLEPGPLWITGPWTARLPGPLKAAGVTALLMAADRLDRPIPGVLAHLDAVLPVIPVVTELDSRPVDAAVVWMVDLDGLEEALARVAESPGCDLTTVDAYLTDHRPDGRRRPVLDDAEAELSTDPDRFVLHRKFVRLVTRIPERLSAAAETAVLDAERRFDSRDLTAAHKSIVAARAAIDSERRRGDDWWRISRLDWDADGSEEIHIELPLVSMLVAPHRSAAVTTLDLKDPVWPVSSVSGEPGWVLARFIGEGDEPTPISMAEIRATEARGGRIEVELGAPIGSGTLGLEVTVQGRKIVARYVLSGAPSGQLGPELKLAMDADARVRIDGSEWTAVTEPIALSGHKIRVADASSQVVITSLTPMTVFLRPGLDGKGLVVWPHWVVAGSTTHELTIDLNG